MLIGFTVGNFRSFKEPVTLSMVAANIVSKPASLDTENVFHVNDNLKLLKSVAMYGANGSGKSNFVAAIQFMRSFVLNSSRNTQINDRIPINQFRLSTETEGQPSLFEIVFVLNNIQYRYGFEVTPSEVVAEWLYDVPTIRERRLFERDHDQITVGTSFKEGKKLEDKTRNNALFLSVVAQFNGQIATHILRWLFNIGIIYGIDDDMYFHFTVEQFRNPKKRQSIIDFMQKVDVGSINNIVHHEEFINFDQVPLEFREQFKPIAQSGGEMSIIRVNTIRSKFDKNNLSSLNEQFDIAEESQGTQKLFALSAPIIDTLENGQILFIDELDARLHPLITSAIIKLFNSSTTNPNNAQLIFTTHDTNLLNNKIFRRDQIWFAEKDRFEATHLHSLVEYKVRNDASFESDYIQGKYGAIPFLGDLSVVVGATHDETP